jgi:ABC-type Fe3+ transport system permease subunit
LAGLASWLIAGHDGGRRLAVQAAAVSDRSVGPILPVVTAIPLFIGLTGLLRPITNGPITPVFRDALITLSESGKATLELGALVVLMVTLLSLLLGKVVVTRPRLWRAVLIAGIVLIGLPPSVYGLGWILLKNRLFLDLTAMPRAMEPALLLSLRWTLLASHFAALAWLSVPTSAMDATRLMGLSRLRRWWLLAWPVLFVRVLPIAVIIALLCIGDATAITIVQPPGWATYATRLFSTMDNAPEKQVAAMCLTYLALPLLLGAFGLGLSKLARPEDASPKP